MAPGPYSQAAFPGRDAARSAAEWCIADPGSRFLQIKQPGSRFCGAPLRAALRPGHRLPLLLPQPHARRVPIGELDTGFFQHALDRRNIVLGWVAAALFEIDDTKVGVRVISPA